MPSRAASPLAHEVHDSSRWLPAAHMQVLDEPLYAHFLRLTGAERPYRDLVCGRC